MRAEVGRRPGRSATGSFEPRSVPAMMRTWPGNGRFIGATGGRVITCAHCLRLMFAMFEFLKKKTTPPAPGKAPTSDAKPSDAPASDAAPPARTGFSPDDLARAFTVLQEEKAARAEAERLQTRDAMRETLGGSLLARSLGGLFSRHPKLDDDLLDEIETALISADVGVTASGEISERLRKRMHKREFANGRALLAALRAELIALLKPIAVPLA
ncbi:MAG TPA: signal recognition particle receptor subunit alpha, partial [Luteimonas sp.]|nr:signal recognition particle receptor subunit alpha [Luteimonas sp.]